MIFKKFKLKKKYYIKPNPCLKRLRKGVAIGTMAALPCDWIYAER